MLSKLHKNAILTAYISSYCLVCECSLDNPEETSDHMQEDAHIEKLLTHPYLEKYGDNRIRKVNKGYFCEFCGILLGTAPKISLHIQERRHYEIKGISLLKRPRGLSGVTAFDDVLISERAFHSLTENTCAICNEEFADENIHKTELTHLLKLMQSKVEFAPGNGIYRKTDETSFQCLTCNSVYALSTLNEHFFDPKHKELYTKCQEEMKKYLKKNKTTNDADKSTKTSVKKIGNDNKIIDKNHNIITELFPKQNSNTIDSERRELVLKTDAYKLVSRDDATVITSANRPVSKDKVTAITTLNKTISEDGATTTSDAEEPVSVDEATVINGSNETISEDEAAVIISANGPVSKDKVTAITSVINAISVDESSFINGSNETISEDEAAVIISANGPVSKDKVTAITSVIKAISVDEASFINGSNETIFEDEAAVIISANGPVSKDKVTAITSVNEAISVDEASFIKASNDTISEDEETFITSSNERISEFEDIFIKRANEVIVFPRANERVSDDEATVTTGANERVFEVIRPRVRELDSDVEMIDVSRANKPVSDDEVIVLPRANEPVSEATVYANRNNITYNNTGHTSAFCRICDTQVPSTLWNMKEHVNGKRHRSKQIITKEPAEEFIRTVSHLDNMFDQDIVINRKYCISLASYVTITSNGTRFRCETCEVNMNKADISSHTNGRRHKQSMEKTYVITSLPGSEFVRQVRPDIYHCGFCNLVMARPEIHSHLEASEHQYNKGLFEEQLPDFLQDHLPIMQVILNKFL